MKDLSGAASAEVSAPIERCFALLSAIEDYPRWYPDVVRQAQALRRAPDGQPEQVAVTLHASVGPLTRDFDLVLDVETLRPNLVKLTRVRHGDEDEERFDVSWRLSGEAPTTIEVTLEASLAVPRLLPVAGLGEGVANGFVDAAVRELGQVERS